MITFIKITILLKNIFLLTYSAPYFLFIIISQCIAGLLNILGITLMVSVIDFILYERNIVTPNKLINLIETALNIELTFVLLSLISIFSLITALCLQSSGQLYAYYARFSVVRKFRDQIFDQHLQLSWKATIRKHSGSLNDIILQQLEMFGAGYFTLFSVWISFFHLITFLILGIFLSLKMMLIVLLIFVVLFFVSISLQIGVRRKSQMSSEAFQNLGIETAEYSNNVKLYKFINNSFLISKFHNITSFIQLKLNKVYNLTIAQNLFIQLSTIFTVLYFIIYNSQFEISTPELLVFILIIQRIGTYALGFYSNLILFQSNLPSIEIVKNYLNYLNEYKEKNGSIIIQNIDSIQFKDVCFFYNESDKILDKFNLMISKKETIAIIGKSGSGKSTLVDLLVLLHTPKNGSILINNVDSNSIDKRSFRRKISYLNQNSTLFKGSIKENITMGEKYTDNQIQEICKRVFLYDWITQLPDQFETLVGEKGSKVSGGQIQRILLARSLIKKPDILILDEATNALDIENLKSINSTLNELHGKISIIIISHDEKNLPIIDRKVLVS